MDFNLSEHTILGRKGEDFAAHMLQQKGYHIEQRNWRLGKIEIDVIASNKQELVFVEVKTRSSHFGGKDPVEYVDARKKRFLIVAANAYLKYYRINKSLRFDIVGIVMNKDTWEVESYQHLENAFQPHARTVTRGKYAGRMIKKDIYKR